MIIVRKQLAFSSWMITTTIAYYGGIDNVERLVKIGLHVGYGVKTI